MTGALDASAVASTMGSASDTGCALTTSSADTTGVWLRDETTSALDTGSARAPGSHHASSHLGACTVGRWLRATSVSARSLKSLKSSLPLTIDFLLLTFAGKAGFCVFCVSDAHPFRKANLEDARRRCPRQQRCQLTLCRQ